MELVVVGREGLSFLVEVEGDLRYWLDGQVDENHELSFDWNQDIFFGYVPGHRIRKEFQDNVDNFEEIDEFLHHFVEVNGIVSWVPIPVSDEPGAFAPYGAVYNKGVGVLIRSMVYY